MSLLKKSLTVCLYGSLFLLKVAVVLAAKETESIPSTVWVSNYEQALFESRSQDKYLFLFFNGSDWSPWGMKLAKEAFRSEPFLSQVTDCFVLFEADFPCYEIQDSHTVERNNYLKSVFGVYEFPSVILLDPKEREVARFSGGMTYDSSEELGAMFVKIFENDRLLSKAYESLSEASIHELKEYYHRFKENRSQEMMQSVLEKGVNLGDDFFLFEKLRLLMNSGRMDSEECKNLKKLLLNNRQMNLKEKSFTIALMEFQELVDRYKKSGQREPEAVLSPLKNYLLQFEHIEDESRWRIEMMMAQFYLDSDLRSPALKHAELAFDCAPPEMKDRIFQSLSYIRNRF